MSFKREDTSNLNVSNLSIMTASMSFENDSDDNNDDDVLAFVHNNLMDSPPYLLPDTPNGHSDSILPPPLLSRPASPETQPKADVDPDVSQFEELAKQHVDSTILAAKAKFSVIMSPHGYKHVFSRNWVSKKSLASVVERPERLKACYLGIGLAKCEVPFKLFKSTTRRSLYSPHFEAVHGKDWADELYALCRRAADKLSKGELEVPESWPYYDMYLCPETVEALEGNIGAVELGVDEIFTSDVRRAFVTVRPPGHHCHEESASGFCIINNAHIAIQYAKAKYGATHAVILDFDLHHGDGSQELLWKLGFDSEGNAEIPMGYFSIHDINSFPCEAGFAQPKQLSDASVCFVAHNSAIWNVHFKPYHSEEEFDSIYNTDYSILFTKAAEFLNSSKTKAAMDRKTFKPLIVISAGFDGSEFETPGMQRHHVHVPTSFYNRFTRDCVALAENYGSGYLISLLEGGYSSAAVSTGVFSHLTGLGELAYNKNWCPVSTTAQEIDYGMRHRWRMHPDKWTARGIDMGRVLLPSKEERTSGGSTTNEDEPTKPKHNLRRRKEVQ